MLLVLLLDFLRNRYWISVFKTWSFFSIFFIIFSYKKKIAVKKLRAGKLTDKIFSRQEKLSLSYILKSFLNFSKVEPQYFYKPYTYKKHSVKSVRIRSYFGPYFPAFELNTDRYSDRSIFRPYAGKYQHNSEYGHFSCTEGCH